MTELPQVIKDIAAAVFPLANAHAKDAGRVLTFSVTESGTSGEEPSLFRIHSFPDAMIQVRTFPEKNTAIILGSKGAQKIESVVSDIALLDQSVSQVSELLLRMD